MSKPEDQQTAEPSLRAKRALWRRMIDWAMAGLVVLAIAWVVLFAAFAPDLPDTNKIWLSKRSPGIVVEAADGSVVTRLGAKGGAPVRVERLPEHLVQAVIATEDRRFYQHFGADVLGLARASWANLMAGRVVQGGSTLTQQLAKNLYLTSERTFGRKLQELFLAIWLEARLTKDDILTLYLNRVYFGAGNYGIEAAARHYFGKPASSVTLPESAVLAGLLKAPTTYDPTRNPKRSRKRAAVVLSNMVEAGYLDAKTAERAKRNPARAVQPKAGKAARYFVDWAVAGIAKQRAMSERDLVLRTTLDPRLQRLAERAIARGLAGEGAKRNAGQAAMVVLDGSGNVRAMVGGSDYARTRFNRAVKAHRQPGSAFKPFVYLAALEAGMTPATKVRDAPLTVEKWSPRNYDGRFAGEIRLVDALARSLNVPAVRVQEKVGRDQVVAVARRLGIASPLKPHPSLALGTSEVTPIELAAAYAAFANGGHRVSPRAVVSIGAGGDQSRNLAGGIGPRVIKRSTARRMHEMLVAVVQRGTGRAARIAGTTVAGKSGTTQEHRDAWFVGYGQGKRGAGLVAAVWFGNDDNAPMKGVTGGGLPARTWRMFMAEALTLGPVIASAEAAPVLPMPRPEGGFRGLIEGFARLLLDGAIPSGEADPDAPVEGAKDAVKDGAMNMLRWALDQAETVIEGEAESDNFGR